VGLGPFTERWRRAQTARPSTAAAGRLWRALREPERPQVALEIRASGVGVVRTRRDGGAVVLAAASAVELPPEVLLPSLTQPNLADPERFRTACRSALEKAGVLDGRAHRPRAARPRRPRGHVPANELAGRPSEMDELVRFRLRKSLPFDVREARVAHVRSSRAPGSRHRGGRASAACSTATKRCAGPSASSRDSSSSAASPCAAPRSRAASPATACSSTGTRATRR
jgi:hypothetical protein